LYFRRRSGQSTEDYFVSQKVCRGGWRNVDGGDTFCGRYAVAVTGLVYIMESRGIGCGGVFCRRNDDGVLVRETVAALRVDPDVQLLKCATAGNLRRSCVDFVLFILAC